MAVIALLFIRCLISNLNDTEDIQKGYIIAQSDILRSIVEN